MEKIKDDDLKQLKLTIAYNLDEKRFRILFNPSIGTETKAMEDIQVSKKKFEVLNKGFGDVYISCGPIDDDRGGVSVTKHEKIGNGISSEKKEQSPLEKLIVIGKKIYQNFFPQKLKEYIKNYDISTIVINSLDFLVPFELMHDGNEFLAKKISFYRKPIFYEDMEHPKINDEIKMQPLQVTFFTNPTGDLENTELETSLIIDFFKSREDLKVDIDNFSKLGASYEAMDEMFFKDKLDIFHYSGHSDVEEDNITFRLADDPYPVTDIALQYPSFFFLNSCESGKVIEQAREFTGSVTLNFPLAVMKRGAKACVATLWPVKDKSSAQFATQFYKLVLEGKTFGDAIRITKEKMVTESHPNDITWNSFVLYGSPVDARLEGLGEEKVDEVEEYLKKVKYMVGDDAEDVGEFLNDNFDKIPFNIRENLLYKLSNDDALSKYIAEIVRDRFETFPLNVRTELLFKLADKESASWHVTWAVASNFNILPKGVGNELLLKLVKKNPTAGDVANALTNKFGNLPEDVRNFLFKLAEKDISAGSVARAVALNFSKLPEEARNELLFKLSEKETTARLVAWVLSNHFDEISEPVKKELLYKLVEMDSAAADLARAIASNFGGLHRKIRNELLLKLVEKDPSARDVASALTNKFGNLPEDGRDLLLKLAERGSSAESVAGALVYDFDKLSVGFRGQLLQILAENLMNIKNPEILNQIGWECWLNKDPEKTVLFAKRAIAIERKSYYAWDTLACGLYDLGKIKESYDAFQEAIRLDPKGQEGITKEVYEKVKKQYKPDQQTNHF